MDAISFLLLLTTGNRTSIINSANSPLVCQVVNAITKVTLPDGKENLFVANNTTLLEDKTERESLAVPYDMMRHGIRVDIVSLKHGGRQGIWVENEYFALHYDEEKTYFTITKPTAEEMDQLEAFELTSPYPHVNRIQQCKRSTAVRLENETMMKEWCKRLALAPMPVIEKNIAKYDATLCTRGNGET